MSLNKAIKSGWEHRSVYGRNRCPSCNRNGSCSWCANGRTFSGRRAALVAQEEIEEWLTQGDEDHEDFYRHEWPTVDQLESDFLFAEWREYDLDHYHSELADDWWDDRDRWDRYEDPWESLRVDRAYDDRFRNKFTAAEWLAGAPCGDYVEDVWRPEQMESGEHWWGDQGCPELGEPNWSVGLRFRYVDKHTPRWQSYEVFASSEAGALNQARKLAKRDGFLVRGVEFKAYQL